MSEEQNQNTETQPSELDELKVRADQMGLSYHPSIGVEKLREKVNAQLADSDDNGPDEDPANTQPSAPGKGGLSQGEIANRRQRNKKREAAELVRVRLTCMNPNKREWDGELFTAANSVVGTFKKFVPFDTEWYVPRIILNQIRQRQCQVFATTRDSRGNKVRKGKLIREFAIEELPNLNEQELKELAQRQAMANGTAEAA